MSLSTGKFATMAHGFEHANSPRGGTNETLSTKFTWSAHHMNLHVGFKKAQKSKEDWLYLPVYQSLSSYPGAVGIIDLHAVLGYS